MTAYYNEFDPYAAQWLRNLIEAGQIAPGIVDERSIEDVRPDELAGFTQCHFFAGVGVWSYALRRAGWDDTRPVWTGSCPCQPFSAAGKGAAFDDERHLWPAFNHLIAECRPPIVLGEQVASAAVAPWIDLVHADLEGLGYAFGGIAFPSAGVGAPHIRDRNYWMAHANGGAGGQGSAHVRGRASGGDAHSRSRLGRGSLSGRLADDQLQQRPHGQRAIGTLDEKGGRQQSAAAIAGLRGVGGMVDADDGISRHRGIQQLIEHGLTPADGGVVLQGSRRAQLEISRLNSGPGPTNGFWRDADWLGCRDGKWRPVEPSSFPLAYGLASGMGALSAGQRRLAGLAGLDAASLKRAKSHRIAGLRGAGNAINAEAAIAWIATVMEAT